MGELSASTNAPIRMGFHEGVRAWRGPDGQIAPATCRGERPAQREAAPGGVQPKEDEV